MTLVHLRPLYANVLFPRGAPEPAGLPHKEFTPLRTGSGFGESVPSEARASHAQRAIVADHLMDLPSWV